MRTFATRVPGRPGTLRALLRRALVALALVLVAAVGTAVPAAAHAGLASSRPAADAVLAVTPSEVRLSFTEPVSPVDGAFTLYDSDGPYSPGVVPAVGRDTVVTVTLPGPLPSGSYLLGWRVVSADSHPVSGVLAFSVGQPSARPPVPPAQADTWTAPLPATVLLVQVLGYLGLLGLVGLRVFDLLLDRPRPPSRRSPLTSAAALVAVASSLLLVGLGTVREQAGSWSDLASAGTWVRSATSPAAAALGLVVTGTVLLLAGGRGPGRAARAVTLVGAVVGVSSVLPVGHTRTTAPTWLMSGLDLVHTGAAAVWFGGLLGLGLHLRRSRRSGSDPVPVAAVVARFSVLAGVLVGLLGLSGVLMAGLVLGSPQALLTTGYGRALLTKLAVVALIGVLAVWNKVHLVRMVGARPDAGAQWRRLRSAVHDEAALLVLVLAVTSLLTMLSPTAPAAPDRTAASSSPAGLQRVELGAGSLQGRLTPARVGRNDLELNLRDASGAPLVTETPPVVSATRADGSLGPLAASVEPREGTGRYRAQLDLPAAGTWRVQVSVRVDRYTEPTSVLVVDVAG